MRKHSVNILRKMLVNLSNAQNVTSFIKFVFSYPPRCGEDPFTSTTEAFLQGAVLCVPEWIDGPSVYMC